MAGLAGMITSHRGELVCLGQNAPTDGGGTTIEEGAYQLLSRKLTMCAPLSEDAHDGCGLLLSQSRLALVLKKSGMLP
jgi:hypothetical protein